ncbi:MAG: glucose-1-phosphate thymidylyltransferase RfbA [Anaerolineales bacterium]|jgi:glucose-1-phosphate thymidylyltransferase
MKGILLAGGSGTRLNPLTVGMSKQLLPIYNKPMVYYPLSMLMLAGIRQILLVSTPRDLPNFKRFLKDGSQWGLSIDYEEQIEPNGIAEALIIGEQFLNREPLCLILGDNIFYGTTLPERLRKGSNLKDGAVVFAYKVRNPQSYAVITYESISPNSGRAISLEEKPTNPLSDFAVPGLYFYDNRAVEFAKQLKPSGRGELEITDLNNIYLERGELTVEVLGRGVAWLDAGTHQSLLQAAQFIQTVEERQGLMISCPEEIAYRMKFISHEEFSQIVERLPQNDYRQYLEDLLKG